MSDLKSNGNNTQSDEFKFPLDFYPEQEQKLINDLVRSRGVSPQHTALSLLPILGRIFSKVRGEASGADYNITPVFWVGIVDQPSSSKSEAAKCWYRPLNKFNRTDEPEDMERYTITDTTVEAIAAHIGQTEDGVVIFHDELTGFFGSMGEYKKSSDKDTGKYLSWFNGDMDDDILRVKETRKMKGQPIQVIGTTQPDTLRESMKKHMNNGLFERFLFSVETNKIARLNRNPNRGLSGEIYNRIERYLDWSRRMPSGMYSFTADADDMFYLWHSEKANEFDNDVMERRIFGKDVVYINRFAMMSAILRSEGGDQKIRVEDVAKAIKLYDFTYAMRKRAFDIVQPKTEFEEMLATTNDQALIKFLKEVKGAKQADIAKALNISPGRVSQLLSGY